MVERRHPSSYIFHFEVLSRGSTKGTKNTSLFANETQKYLEMVYARAPLTHDVQLEVQLEDA